MVDVDRFWKGFEEGYEVAREGVRYAAGLAEDASVRAGIRLKIFTRKRQLERGFTLLGKTVYSLHKEKKVNVMASPKVKSGLKEIKTLEAEILKLLKRLEKESTEKPAKKKRAAGSKKPRRRKTSK